MGKFEIIQYGYELKWWVKLLRFFGYKFIKLQVFEEDGKLLVKGDLGEFELNEYLPGLFFTSSGETFDLRNENPTFMNISLKKYSR